MPSIRTIRTQLIFLILVFLVGHTQCCFECSGPALTSMRFFHYTIKSLYDNKADKYESVLEYAKTVLEEVKTHLQTPMLDHYALAQIASEYEKCVNTIVRPKAKGEQLFSLIKVHYNRLKEKFTNIVEKFKQRFCPNKHGEGSCGIVVHAFTECVACEWKKVYCIGGPRSNQEWFDNCGCFCFHEACYNMESDLECTSCKDFSDYFTRALLCKVKHIEVSETGAMQLDCYLEWHNKLEEPIKYMFHKFDSPKDPFYTDEALFEKKFVNTADAGDYMCVAMNFSGFPISTIAYKVEVVKAEKTPASILQTLPSNLQALSATIETNLNKYAPSVVVICCILIVLGILCICVYLVARKEPERIGVLRKEKGLDDMMRRLID